MLSLTTTTATAILTSTSLYGATAGTWGNTWSGVFIVVLAVIVIGGGICFLLLHHRNKNYQAGNDRTHETYNDVMNGDDLLEGSDERNEYGAASQRTNRQQMSSADLLMVERMNKYIKDHISDPNLKIEDLSNAVNLGRTVYYEKMKNLMGMSPSDYLRHIRMEQAKELVATSDMTISQVAYHVGFTDPKYFRICFKKETGKTPSEYRQTAHE